MAHDKLPRGLYALIDDSLLPERSLVDQATAAMEGGAAVVQLRLEQTPDRPALEVIRAVVEEGRRRGVPVIVNDRVDLALVGRASGVHLGKEDLPVEAARRLLGPEALVGATVRSLEDIMSAARDGADHVGLGPIFPTTTKSVDAPALGLLGFEAIVRVSPLPVVGIAGITLDTIGAVARAGARAAAVAGDLARAVDPVSRARALREAFLAGNP